MTVHTDREHRSPLRMPVLAAAVLLAAATFIGYRVGVSSSSTSPVLVGNAYVGDSQATVRVGSWSYDIPISDGAVEWFDSTGEHDGGVAPCLRASGSHVRVRFAYSTVHGPSGDWWRQVGWVQCLARP